GNAARGSLICGSVGVHRATGGGRLDRRRGQRRGVRRRLPALLALAEQVGDASKAPRGALRALRSAGVPAGAGPSGEAGKQAAARLPAALSTGLATGLAAALSTGLRARLRATALPGEAGEQAVARLPAALSTGLAAGLPATAGAAAEQATAPTTAAAAALAGAAAEQATAPTTAAAAALARAAADQAPAAAAELTGDRRRTPPGALLLPRPTHQRHRAGTDRAARQQADPADDRGGSRPESDRAERDLGQRPAEKAGPLLGLGAHHCHPPYTCACVCVCGC